MGKDSVLALATNKQKFKHTKKNYIQLSFILVHEYF